MAIISLTSYTNLNILVSVLAIICVLDGICSPCTVPFSSTHHHLNNLSNKLGEIH